jgi:polar amino acid transport system substrate-binding protein
VRVVRHANRVTGEVTPESCNFNKSSGLGILQRVRGCKKRVNIHPQCHEAPGTGAVGKMRTPYRSKERAVQRRLWLTATALATSVLLSACSMFGMAPDPAKRGASADLLPQRYRDAGVINVGSLFPYPPMTYFDDQGNLTGFDYDLGQELGNRLGVEFEVVHQEWPTVIPSLQAGLHDIIISSMNDTLERQKTLDFVDYFGGGYSILVPKGNPLGISNLSDLCGRSAAVPTNAAQSAIVEDASSKCPAGKPINIVYLPDDAQAQEAVRAGNVDADIQDAAISSFVAMVAGDGLYFDSIANAANPSEDISILTGIGVLKGNDDLVRALQAAVQELMDDGTYMQLLRKYNLQDFGLKKATINGAGLYAETR